MTEVTSRDTGSEFVKLYTFSIEEAAIFDHPRVEQENDPTPIYNTTDEEFEIILDYNESGKILGSQPPEVQRMFLCFIALAEGRELPDALEGDEQ